MPSLESGTSRAEAIVSLRLLALVGSEVCIDVLKAGVQRAMQAMHVIHGVDVPDALWTRLYDGEATHLNGGGIVCQRVGADERLGTTGSMAARAPFHG